MPEVLTVQEPSTATGPAPVGNNSLETSPQVLLLKQQKLRLLEEKLRAVRQDGLPFYRPHPKQDLFHRSVARRRGVFTGNRFGKSTMGCAEDCAWLRGERPWLAESDPGRKSGIPQHPVKGLVIANDWDKVDEIWTGQDGKLWRFLPKDGFIKKVTRNHSGAIDNVTTSSPFGGTSTLRFDTVRSFMSNPLGSESSDWDFIHVDEPCPEKMFKAAGRGLIDRMGSAWFTLTAIAEPWITDAFEPEGVFANAGIFVIEGTIYDNTFLHKEAIDDYEGTLTEDEKSCRLYGKPLHKSGLIYKMFQRDKHVLSELPKGWRSFAEPPESWSHYLYIDPHPHTPKMVLFLAVDPFGRPYYFKDIFDPCLIKELCGKIRTTLNGRRIVRARLDPLAWVEDPVHGTTMAQEFMNCGIAVEKASKDLSRGILRAQEALSHPTAFPLFSPECRRTIWEFGRYRWDEETNKPVDADDHAMECFYRSVLDEPKFVEPQTGKQAVEDLVITKPDFDLVPVFQRGEVFTSSETLMYN